MTVKLGLSINLCDPAVMEIAGWIGYEFAWIDCEQTLFPNVAEMIRAAEAAGVEPWVRVVRNDAAEIGRCLNLGARAVIIPHICSREEAELAVRHTKFKPLGGRNWFTKARDRRYGLTPTREYLASRASAAMLVLQVEDPEGVEVIEDMLGVAGIDMVATGPGDLSHSLGIPGDIHDPRILDAEVRIFTAAGERNVPVLHFAETRADLEALRRSYPVTHVVAASDTTALIGILRDRFERLTGRAAGRGA